jgi:uncharacterized protein YllA (UPF0747 family)
MQVTLHARLPAEDAAQKLLFASPEGSAVFPGGSFRSETAVKRRVAHLDARAAGPKPPGPATKGLQDLLRLENAFAPLTAEQAANLEAAGSDRALFVLTGQQPGLFGGPILWLYKALTCAALAKEWSKRLSRPVIPIFWAAGDDADLAECNHVELLDAGAQDVPGPLSLAFPDAGRPIAVGARPIDAGGLDELLSRLGGLWKPETLSALRRCYPAGGTLTDGFLRLAQSHLGREGILFVDGYSPNIRALGRPILEKAVRGWESHQARLLEGTEAAKAAGIDTQVSLRAGVVHAFVLRDGERHRLFAEKKTGAESGANTKGNVKGTQAASAKIYIPENPTRDLLPELAGLELTHDVFTRPLIADAIFPVLGHVLGPAEIRYFAQMSRLFPETTGDMPLVHPRMTAAVASDSARRDFLREGLDIPELVRVGPSGLRAKLEERTWKAHPASAALSPEPDRLWLEGLRKVHGAHFKDAGPLDRLEKTMASAWKRYLRSLERMAYDAASGSGARLFSHLRWLGGGVGQDRHLNLASLLDALGLDGLDRLRAALDPASPELQLFLTSDDGSIDGQEGA